MEKGFPPGTPTFVTNLRTGSNPDHVFRLQTLWTLFDLEFHFRAFVQGPIPVRLDRGKMNEHVVTARPLDESIALCGIKPFNCAFFLHYTSPETLFAVLLGPRGKESATFEAC